MDNESLATLNEQQRRVVCAEPSNLLVIAGAGSGKTRVLVQRIAWLIHQQQISPYNILAVTFTNKAAGEMRGRIESLLGFSVRGMWVGTFHSLAHRLLRTHWSDANLPQSFQILDSEDQLRLLKRVHRQLNLEEKKWPPKRSQWFINMHKDAGRRSHQVTTDDKPYTDMMIKIYQEYERICQQGGLVDFAELLLRCFELLQNHPDVLAHYQQRFFHILVDEFQDTNSVQYDWVKLIAGQQATVMAVGDDDQSIYSWRGAKVENIQRFKKEFANVETIRLEQNYRSTQTILDAANAVIAHNQNRLGKKLWSAGKQGDLIVEYAAFNEIEEARYIVQQIQHWLSEDFVRSDVAILYRSNAQSRVLEEALLHVNIPYRIYGGLKFFDRAEIKDALAYLRLATNIDDDSAFERVVNMPPRGIGQVTMQRLRDAARNNTQSLWQAAKTLTAEQTLGARGGKMVLQFLQLMETLSTQLDELPLHEQVQHLIEHSGLMQHYNNDRTERGASRVENLEELISATKVFADEYEDEEFTPLQGFLAHVALETGEYQADNFADGVQLMTLHAAKGLEFPIVFLCGMEEGGFPHKLSMHDAARLEEERRLCYVGMTRAKQKLYLTHAECRRVYGEENYQRPSRFLNEIPRACVHQVRLTTKVTRPVSVVKRKTTQQAVSVGGLQLGQRVQHTKFGEGTVIGLEAQGANPRLQIKFDRFGSKWLMLNVAKLEPA